MTEKRAPKPDNPEQYRRFLDMAKEVEARDDPQEFEKAFGKVANTKPPKDVAMK